MIRFNNSVPLDNCNDATAETYIQLFIRGVYSNSLVEQNPISNHIFCPTNAVAPAMDLTVAAPGKWYKIKLDVQCAMTKPSGKVVSAKVAAEN